jgi:hypothetical protein
MNTSPRKLGQFDVPLLIVLSAVTLGWFVQTIGVVAVLFIVILVKRAGKFEAQLAASTFTLASALFALISLSAQSRMGNAGESRLLIPSIWHHFAERLFFKAVSPG